MDSVWSYLDGWSEGFGGPERERNVVITTYSQTARCQCKKQKHVRGLKAVGRLSGLLSPRQSSMGSSFLSRISSYTPKK